MARSVGVSHATLVHHFTTKDDLVAEIVDLVLAQSLALPDLADDEERVRAAFEDLVAELGRRSAHWPPPNPRA